MSFDCLCNDSVLNLHLVKQTCPVGMAVAVRRNMDVVWLKNVVPHRKRLSDINAKNFERVAGR